MRSVTIAICLALVGSLAVRPLDRAGGSERSMQPADRAGGERHSGDQVPPRAPVARDQQDLLLLLGGHPFDLTSRTATVQIVTTAAFDFGKQIGAHGPLAGRSAGVGDESYYVSAGSYAKLGVRKGGRAFSITVTSGAGKIRPTRWLTLRRRWRRMRWRGSRRFGRSVGYGAAAEEGRRS